MHALVLMSSTNRNIEYHSLAQLYSHVERKWLIDVNQYSSFLFDCGPDIYRQRRPGLYCGRTGKFLAAFDGKAYWETDSFTKVYVDDIDGVRNARGGIINEFGKTVLTYGDLKRGYFTELPPIRARANALTRAYIGDMLSEYFEVTIQPNIGELADTIADDARENPALRTALLAIERKFLSDYRPELENYDWHDFTAVMDRTGAIILEMGMDVRIREYYETRLRDEVRRLTEQD